MNFNIPKPKIDYLWSSIEFDSKYGGPKPGCPFAVTNSVTVDVKRKIYEKDVTGPHLKCPTSIHFCKLGAVWECEFDGHPVALLVGSEMGMWKARAYVLGLDESPAVLANPAQAW